MTTKRKTKPAPLNAEALRGDLQKLYKAMNAARLHAQLAQAAARGEDLDLGIGSPVFADDIGEFIAPRVVESIEAADAILDRLIEQLGLGPLFISPADLAAEEKAAQQAARQ